jgi:hypothetical protein
MARRRLAFGAQSVVFDRSCWRLKNAVSLAPEVLKIVSFVRNSAGMLTSSAI